MRLKSASGKKVGDLAEVRGINRANDYAFKRIFGSGRSAD